MRLINADNLDSFLKEARDALCDDKAIKDLRIRYQTMLLNFQQIIDLQPTVDPVVYGEWISIPETISSHSTRCSICGIENIYSDIYGSAESNFCPNCGADMQLRIKEVLSESR